MTVSDEVVSADSSRGYRMNYRHGMFAFLTPDSLKDYTYGMGDILAIHGRLSRFAFPREYIH